MVPFGRPFIRFPISIPLQLSVFCTIFKKLSLIYAIKKGSRGRDHVP